MTHLSGVEIIANYAVQKAADRLDILYPGLGVDQARYQGFRAAVRLSEEQRQLLYTISHDLHLTHAEKWERMGEAGLIDVALASALIGIAGFGVRGFPFGPADRPGGGPISRLPRTLALRDRNEGEAPGRPGSADAVARTIRATQDPRETPGIISGTGVKVSDQWLADMNAPVPAQLAALLRGQNVSSMRDFREIFWKAAATLPELAAQFTSQNVRFMRDGLAPKAPRNQQLGAQKVFHLHHPHRIIDGGPVYDVDNIRVVSPLKHKQIHSVRSP